MVRIVLHGCNGKMGQVVAQYAAATPDMEIVAGIDVGATQHAPDFPVFAKLSDCDLEADVVIDFSAPEALSGLLEGAVRKKIALLIATTGHTDEDRALVREKANIIPILQAANMSVGVNLISDLIQKAAAVLGEGFDIEIVEKHHNLKKDAPSGTAYALAEAMNQVFLNSKNYIFGRHARNQRRAEKEIGIHAVRGGTIVGEHQVIFAGKDELVEITHAAFSKQVFAAGAIQAARYLTGKPVGFYTMKDMIVEHSAVTNLYRGDDEALISINKVPADPQIISGLFKRVGEENINLDMISQTAPVENEVSISFTLPRDDVEKTLQVVREFEKPMLDYWMDVVKDISKITVEGAGMERQSGVAAHLFEIMAEQKIVIKTVTTSETKISYIIDQRDADRAVSAIKEAFEL
jgi:4-hydroxy-tetrahydrodipicolinate reductase